MLKIKSLYIIIISIPLLILLVIGLYSSDKSWQKYQENKAVQNRLNNAELLEKYEISTLHEILCSKLILEQSSNAKNICKERIEISRKLAQTLKKEENDDVEYLANKIAQYKNVCSKKKIENFETFLGKKDIYSISHQFLKNVKNETKSNEIKKLLSIYAQISDKRYATELENFLVTYYVSKHIPVSTLNVIYWDKIVSASSLSDINIETLDDVTRVLQKILSSKPLNKILSKIDDMRITILTGSMHPDKKYLDWITLLEKKSHILAKMQNSVKTSIDNITLNEKKEAFRSLLFYLSMSLLSFLALVILYMKAKKEERENKSLSDLLDNLAVDIPYTHKEYDVMQNMLHNIQSKEDIFNYISENFKLLHEKVEQAHEDVKSKSNFIATLSHEIRTPLNGIIGFSKLLKDTGATVNQKEFLSLIEDSAHNLIAIVSDILALSKINAEKMEIDTTSFDLFDTVESAVSTFIKQANEKNIELALFIDPFLQRHFLGDATKISQILINLIVNAVKFTEPYGKINIFVQKIQNNENEVKIKFSVDDNGIGIPEDQMKNIFNPYAQVHTTTKKNLGGTGLGLSISRGMLELMDSKLEVRSHVNKGTTFYFTVILQIDKEKVLEPYPRFEDATVGLALPVRNIKRQLDTNLETYIRYLGAKFKIYYYEELFEDNVWVELPDIMIFDHHYARLSGELERCAAIDCKSVLLTDSTLHSRIDPNEHHFTDVVFVPITLHKAIRILNGIKSEIAISQNKVEKSDDINAFENINVLVAEDNIINQKLIKIILENMGLRVTLSQNGQEAFDKFKEGNYDIIFMDIHMPVLNGVESTQKILAYEKKHGLKHIPIIALTANAGVNDKEHYLSEGMDDYIVKPLDVEILKGTINKHCFATETSEDKEK